MHFQSLYYDLFLLFSFNRFQGSFLKLCTIFLLLNFFLYCVILCVLESGKIFYHLKSKIFCLYLIFVLNLIMINYFCVSIFIIYLISKLCLIILRDISVTFYLRIYVCHLFSFNKFVMNCLLFELTTIHLISP